MGEAERAGNYRSGTFNSPPFFVYLYRAAFGKARIYPEEIQSMTEKSIVMCQSSDL